ncbi:DUF262 domain-containing protein [Hwangdonia lutea]|uniref:DUF262 domain-containing protein n=1 Tax=Hwangdonia lutea TaxID=3075823 RepID=A0AA97EN27_9FLAO|nr:DUF262 domain-containing protein [Hwangdonia sp. SCSIO 19198]WOD43474.1 DUF262 domain-containing protein [Hwangdonia sp. SCSIO 19198]
MENKYTYPFDEELKEEVKQGVEDDFEESPPKDIVAYNELRSCADIFRMYKSGQLEIQPYFQRDVVWSKPAQSRFVDSLIKQLPIPSMCFSLDFNSDERYVIDGLQRIQSIINFLSKEEWTLSPLEDIDPAISGKSIRSIKKNNPSYYSRVQNLTIPITVIRCNHNKKEHLEYLFTIFHRLNSGGTKLNNQEIRNCIYSGSFNEFLKSITVFKHYQSLFDIDSNKNYRFSFEELNLRFFALSEDFENYSGRLSKWLNDYMFSNRFLDDNTIEIKRKEFEDVITIIYTRVFENTAVKKISKSIIEAIYVGVQRNLQDIKKSQTILNQKYQTLRQDPLFSSDELSEGVARKNKVIKRLNRAVEIFAE